MKRSRLCAPLWAMAISSFVLVTVAGCDSVPGQPDDEATGLSRAYGAWEPGSEDTCTPADHDRFSMVGPHGKLYPTWHPPVDPATGCSFGHEHGRDPRGSRLYGAVGDIPFGYANERLAIYDPSGVRDEDHVGHKIEWENDIALQFPDVAVGVLEVHCDVLAKLHQGSHSKDAFTNNLHELAYHLRCTDGTELHVTLLTPIGEPGAFSVSCDRDVTVAVGPPTPANSPSGGGHRLIPDRTCIERFLLVPEGERSNFRAALRESWQTSNRIRAESGRTLAFFNPYFNVFLPSRYYDPSAPEGVGRTIDICYESGSGGTRARGGPCESSTSDGTLPDVEYDDSRSAFNGARRSLDINSNVIRNADGPSIWYSDPFGRNARTERFAGSIAQFIAVVDTDRAINPGGPTIGSERDYGETGVHAPN